MPNFKELAENNTGPRCGPVVEKFLVAVVLWLEWAFDFHSDIIGLVSAKGFELYTDLLEVQGCYFLVQMLWQDVYFVLVLIAAQPKL
jgi:hypothetical protein